MTRVCMFAQAFVAGLVVKDGLDNGTVAPVWLGLSMMMTTALVLLDDVA